ncbi:unnamed protein product [Prorocentrum cordatum]|uniref:Protein kinase domain-containing protein n=1 Tax=Prorocentrum cordatum TaxID=2364126 RepID=A0ABN9VH98_9DINO|nr:unnamed protein product [Polarella glacialis]
MRRWPKMPALRPAARRRCGTTWAARGQRRRSPGLQKEEQELAEELGPEAPEGSGSRYRVVRQIGSGAYGTVFEAQDTLEDRLVAIKRVKLENDPVHLRRTLREVALLSRLRGAASIVSVLDIMVPVRDGRFTEVHVVLERCRTDLRKICSTVAGLTMSQVRRILYTTTRGVAYLHSAGVWHRDLKPANCLMYPDCEVRIADFGLARAVGRPPARLPDPDPARPRACPAEQTAGFTVHVCTRWYRPPELLLAQREYSGAIDVWALGCIFAELLQCVETPPEARQGPLFRGDYARRVGGGHLVWPPEAPRAPRDQLDMIFNMIGVPSVAELAELQNQEAVDHVLGFPPRSASGIQAAVPQADEWALDVLRRTLRFSPPDRMTARELLEHRCVAGVRDRQGESLADEVLTLPFEDEPDDIGRLAEYLVHELEHFGAFGRSSKGKGNGV